MSAVDYDTKLGTGRVDFDRDLEEKLGGPDDGADYTGWFCVATSSFPCPARGCDFVAGHMTAAHRIIVWPERDDPRLLMYANDAKKLGRNPRVVEYATGMGPCVSFDRWKALGNPVHGKLPRPEGWRT